MNSHEFPSAKAVETLQLELSLLKILHHRNKNQHHLQPFFKHLSILKRTLSYLLDNVESEYLVQKLRKVVIPSSWESFSRLVARGEFVGLGLVLCGCCARISYCLGGVEESMSLDSEAGLEYGPSEEERSELGEAVLRVLLEESGEDFSAIEECGDTTEPSPPISPAADNVEEPQRELGTQPSEEAAKSTAECQGIGEIQPPTKRRRKKTKEYIDVLFAGLD